MSFAYCSRCYATRMLSTTLYDGTCRQLIFGAVKLLPHRVWWRQMRTMSKAFWSGFPESVIRWRCRYRFCKPVSEIKQVAFVSSDQMTKLRSKLDTKYYHEALQKLRDDDLYSEIIGSTINDHHKRPLFSILKELSVLRRQDLIEDYVESIQYLLINKYDKLHSKDREELSHCLDRVLFFYWRKGDYNAGKSLFEFMRDFSLVTSASYDLMIRITCKSLPEFEHVVEKLIVEMKRARFHPSARTFFPLLLKYISVRKYENAVLTFAAIKDVEANFHDENHGHLLTALAKTSKSFLENKLFHEVLEYHKETGYLYGQFAKSAIQNAFESLSNDGWRLEDCDVDFRGWNIASSVRTFEAVELFQDGMPFLTTTDGHYSGRCSSCHCQLDTISVTKEDKEKMSGGLAWFLKLRLAEDIPTADMNDSTALAKYYRDLGEIIKDHHILNAKVRDFRTATLRRLKYFLNRTGPYDIVVDMLNLGYSGEKGYNAAKVEVTVRELLEQGKKVVGLCAGPLREYLLRGGIRLQADEVRLHKMVQRLKKWGCGLFFVGNSKHDDLFILFALLHHNFNVLLLTDDKFQDHLDGMDKFAVVAFKKWLKLNTIRLVRFEEGRPVFEVGNAVDCVVQRHKNAYHFPLKDGRWLCCSKEGASRADLQAIEALRNVSPS